MKQNTDSSSFSLLPDAGAYDPIEDRLRANVRATIEAMFEEELADFLGRLRYGRGNERAKGYRHGHRDRQLTGTFGTETVRVPRARIENEAGKITEWRSKALPRYRRLTKKAEALIAAVYLAGTNMRRVKRALFGLFEGAVSKDVVSRAWRKVKVDWDAWSTRDLAEEDIVRLILDGTVIKTRLDCKATNISVLAAIGVRRDGQKVLLSIRNMGGESTAAWSQFLADLDARGLRRPEFVIVDGAPGLEAALVALWGEDLAIQRCTVHKHRNLLGHAPKRLHDELSEDYRDMIYADSAAEIETRRKAFLRKWKLKCRAVADSLEEAGDRLFSFTRLDPSQWKSARTTNAIERLNEEFRRRIKTQTVLPCAETVPMLLWALLASGQIQMRKVDGWETLSQPLVPMSLDLAACLEPMSHARSPLLGNFHHIRDTTGPYRRKQLSDETQKPFKVENDTTAGYWSNNPANTMPIPDMMGAYMRNRPYPGNQVEGRKAWIVGSGIAGLAAAFYMIRDGGMKGQDITVLDALDVTGGSLDGAGNAEDGYIIRGGREMNFNYDNLWDMFQDVQALELPEGYSVLDEYRLLNDNDSNWSKSRLMHKQGEVKDFSTFGLTRSQQWELIRLMLKRKEDLDDLTIEQYFSKDFLQTNFWFLWRSMFAFENWQSALEMKLYIHRFLDSIDGFADMSCLVFPKYNQHDTFVKPLVEHLKKHGVQVQFGTRVYDLEMSEDGDKRTVTGILAKVNGADERIAVRNTDIVIALTGSMTEGTAYGDMDNAPVLDRGRADPGPDSDWALWKNLAAKSPVFGKPQKFYGNVDKSMWESATLTCKPSPLVERLRELSINDPYSGKTVTGGIITFTDSNWVMSVTCNRQPHFPGQPGDTLVLWVYGLLMDKAGNRVAKTMPECTGREILQELCHHLGIPEDQFDAVAANTKVRLALMPYITSMFMPRAAGDRPHVVPAGSTNLGLVGQFVETANDIVFTMDSSIRTARVAVYSLLGLRKQVPDVSPVQYDIRTLLKAARTVNNNEPFPGERLLHRLLGKTYYAHILPPLPDRNQGTREAAEAELKTIFGNVGQAPALIGGWLQKIRDEFKLLKGR